MVEQESNLIPGTHKAEERADLCRLSPSLQMHVCVQAHAHTWTHMLNLKFNVNVLFCFMCMCILPVCMPMQYMHAYRDQKRHQIPWHWEAQTAVGFQVELGTKPSPLQEQQVVLTSEPISPVASFPQFLNKRVISFRMLVRISLEKLVLTPPQNQTA